MRVASASFARCIEAGHGRTLRLLLALRDHVVKGMPPVSSQVRGEVLK